MNYFKKIDIEAQNIYAFAIHKSLDILEREIERIINGYYYTLEKDNPEAIFEGLRRLYITYSEMQINLWVRQA